MKRSLIALLVAAVSTGVAAKDYQNETSLNYGWGDIGSSSLNSWQLGHRYYFDPVRTSGKTPYAESAFMNRNSNVSASVGRTSVGDYDTNGWSIAGEYMSQQNDWYGSIEWAHFNKVDAENINATLGYFFAKDWMVGIVAEHYRPDESGSSTNYGITTKKLWDVGGNDMVNLEAEVLDFRNLSTTRFSVGGDYYFGKSFSAGLGYSWLSDSNATDSDGSLSLRSRWFMQPNLSLQAAIAFDSLDTGDDQYSVGVSYRF